jgi:hypothetical protein
MMTSVMLVTVEMVESAPSRCSGDMADLSTPPHMHKRVSLLADTGAHD